MSLNTKDQGVKARDDEIKELKRFFRSGALNKAVKILEVCLQHRSDVSYAKRIYGGFSLEAALMAFFGEKADYRAYRLAELLTMENKEVNLAGFDFSGLQLVKLNRLQLPFEGIMLKGANLKGVNLSDSDLRNADLSSANLSKAILYRTNLNGANLNGANLTGANLIRANLKKADLRCANLKNADLRCANLKNADLRCANLKKADLRCATLKNGVLRGVAFIEADLRNADLRGADLIGASLTSANLEGAILDIKTNLTFTNLVEAFLLEESKKFLTEEQGQSAKFRVNGSDALSFQRVDPNTSPVVPQMVFFKQQQQQQQPESRETDTPNPNPNNINRTIS